MKPYLYLKGLKELVHELNGNEIIHIGIRPYGFHAGNTVALIVYPFLLCKFFSDRGLVPKFRFVISINDWEQDALDGPDPRKYPFNIRPKTSSLQFTPDDFGCCRSIVDHWEKRIKDRVSLIQKKFKEISLKFVRNSELIEYESCRVFLAETVRNPRKQLAILKKHSDADILDEPIQFAGVVCPKCKKTKGDTRSSVGAEINWVCHTCSYSSSGDIRDFDYWWYHKPMLIARLDIFNVDVTLSGGDHFSEGDFNIRRDFIRTFSPKTKEPLMLFTPTVFAKDGNKMSKSRNNTEFSDIGKLIKAMSDYDGGRFDIRDELITDSLDEKDYSHIL
jgi:lysyl-tRNA synthetase class I